MKRLTKSLINNFRGWTFLGSVIFIFVLATSCTDDAEFIPPDLVLHYSFDVNYKSTVQNLAVDQFHGTIYGGSRIEEGIIGKCLQLSDTGSRIELGGFDKFIKQELSIEAWIYAVNLDSLSIHQIIGSGYYGVKSFRYQINNRKLKFVLCFSSSETELITGNFELQNNEWYHIVFTYDGSTACTYVNGELDNSVNIIYSIQNPIYSPYIGCTATRNFGWTNQFEGYIDELKVYGIAKSAKDILASYKSSKP